VPCCVFVCSFVSSPCGKAAKTQKTEQDESLASGKDDENEYHKRLLLQWRGSHQKNMITKIVSRQELKRYGWSNTMKVLLMTTYEHNKNDA
jgi:hypothetical protein